MGRIYEERGGPDNMRWFGSLYGVVGKPSRMQERPCADARRGQGAVEGLSAMAGVGQAAGDGLASA